MNYRPTGGVYWVSNAIADTTVVYFIFTTDSPRNVDNDANVLKANTGYSLRCIKK